MANFGLRARAAALGIMIMLGAGASAQAQTVAWTFNGNCIDCAQANGSSTYAVTGVLTLQDYLEGTPLTDANFVSFYYGGSNLMLPYLVDFNGGSPPPVHHYPGLENFISGSLTNGGSQTLNLAFGDGLEFTMDANGNWFTCGTNGTNYYDSPCSWQNNTDTGDQGGLSLAPPPTTAVPEPGTYALMTIGLGALGVAARRRQRTH